MDKQMRYRGMHESKLGSNDSPIALFSERHLSTLLTSSGVLLPAWISASKRRVRGGSVNGVTVKSHAWFSGASTDRSDCEPVYAKEIRKGPN